MMSPNVDVISQNSGHTTSSMISGNAPSSVQSHKELFNSTIKADRSSSVFNKLSHKKSSKGNVINYIERNKLELETIKLKR